MIIVIMLFCRWLNWSTENKSHVTNKPGKFRTLSASTCRHFYVFSSCISLLDGFPWQKEYVAELRPQEQPSTKEVQELVDKTTASLPLCEIITSNSTESPEGLSPSCPSSNLLIYVLFLGFPSFQVSLSHSLTTLPATTSSINYLHPNPCLWRNAD